MGGPGRGFGGSWRGLEGVWRGVPSKSHFLGVGFGGPWRGFGGVPSKRDLVWGVSGGGYPQKGVLGYLFPGGRDTGGCKICEALQIFQGSLELTLGEKGVLWGTGEKGAIIRVIYALTDCQTAMRLGWGTHGKMGRKRRYPHFPVAAARFRPSTEILALWGLRGLSSCSVGLSQKTSLSGALRVFPGRLLTPFICLCFLPSSYHVCVMSCL